MYFSQYTRSHPTNLLLPAPFINRGPGWGTQLCAVMAFDVILSLRADWPDSPGWAHRFLVVILFVWLGFDYAPASVWRKWLFVPFPFRFPFPFPFPFPGCICAKASSATCHCLSAVAVPNDSSLCFWFRFCFRWMGELVMFLLLQQLHTMRLGCAIFISISIFFACPNVRNSGLSQGGKGWVWKLGVPCLAIHHCFYLGFPCHWRRP